MPFEFKDDQDIGMKRFKRDIRNAMIMVGSAGLMIGFILGSVLV